MSPGSRVLAIANVRAGMGKTTVAVNLAHAFALAGKAALVVDLDPGASATRHLGAEPGTTGLLGRIAVGEEPTSQIGLLVRSIEAGLDLIAADTHAAPPAAAGLHLRGAVDDLRSQYSWIVVDCPPLQGFWTRTGLAASDAVIVPFLGQPEAVASVEETLALHQEMRASGETRSVIDAVVATVVQRNEGLTSWEGLSAECRDRIARTEIPRDPAFEEAARQGKTVLSHDLESRASRSIVQLARELMTHGR